jgi:hypothetical protein
MADSNAREEKYGGWKQSLNELLRAVAVQQAVQVPMDDEGQFASRTQGPLISADR